MKVGIIGSGGREHAICQSIKKSSKIDKIFCFPGNAGTENIAENINIDLSNFENIKNFILNKKIDLIIIGPEKPLVEGLADYLEKFKIKVFGPNKIASQLEGSTGGGYIQASSWRKSAHARHFLTCRGEALDCFRVRCDIFGVDRCRSWMLRWLHRWRQHRRRRRCRS